MRKIIVVGFLCVIAGLMLAQSQDVDSLIVSSIKMLEEGKADQVKAELPSLMSKYQNHPGIMYLQGRLALNGAEAAKYYQSVVDNFPKSEWADDALYRVYLYYASLGLARTAELKLQQLRKDYPHSPYLREKPPVVQTPEEKEPTVIIPPPVVPPESTETSKKDGETKASSTMESGLYAIQVGAFSSLDNATKLKSFFEELSYPVEVQNKVRGGQSLYLVWVGHFSTADEAKRFAAEVKSKHKIESIVISR